MSIKVLGFYNGLNEKAKGYRYLEQYGGVLNEVVLFNISIQDNGELRGIPSRKLIAEAHEMGIKVFPAIANLAPQGGFSTALLSRLVRDREFANRVWRRIYDFLVVYQCDGVNFDLEKAAPEDRNLFTQLILTWTRRLQQENFIVTVDVPAKTADDPKAEWQGAFDYRAMGLIADAVILMTYEEHWPGSQPGSVASLPWVRQVIDYAGANIAREKLYLGIPIYGYDWAARGGAQAISYQKALLTARRFGSPIRWDSQQHSAYFRYETMGQRHTVYFEDLRSVKEKLDLAVSQNLAGVAVWEMNLSYPELWQLLQLYTE